MTTRRLAVIQLTLLTSGCSHLFAPVDASVSAALIDPLPADGPRAARTRGVLLVAPPTCRPAYDTVRMAYSLREHEVEFYAHHEWAERPAQMLRPLLVRTLEATHCCTAVVAPPHAGAWDIVLRIDIRELLQDFAAEPPRLRLALRVVIESREKTLGVHDIAIAEPMHARNAEAGIAAANEATAKALRTIAQQVIDALA